MAFSVGIKRFTYLLTYLPGMKLDRKQMNTGGHDKVWRIWI